MKIKNTMLKYVVVVLLLSSLFSCEKMADNYQPYLEGGEIIYTSKVDSLQAFPGKNRIKLVYFIISDPNINNSRVYWNGGSDSIDVPIQRSAGIDTIQTVIDNLEEGIYTFNVVTFDQDGNHSTKSEVISNVYGDVYAGTISNRPLKKMTFFSNTNIARLEWYGVSQRAVVVEAVYTNIDGVETTMKIQKVIVDPRKPATFKDVSLLPDISLNSAVKYRTGYLPEESAIDTFFTPFTTINNFEVGFQLPDYFKVTAKHSGKSLMVQDGSGSKGAKVVQGTFGMSAESIWKLSENSDGYTVFTNINSGLDMGVSGASVDDGAAIIQWSQGSNTNDEWTVERLENSDFYRVINRKSGKVLEVADQSMDDNAPLIQNNWMDADNQKFEIEAVKSKAPPASPSNLSATVSSSSEIVLNWNDNSDNEFLFRIERSDNGNDWSSIATIGGNKTSYTDKNLSAATQYFYRVKAENTAGGSEYTNVVDVKTKDIQVLLGTTEAESLKLTDFTIQTGYNGEDVAKPTSKDIVGNMRGVFAGPSGVYDVIIRAFDENDGQAVITLKVNGISQGSKTLDVDDNQWKELLFSGISIEEGVEVMVEASQNDGEQVRIDKIIIQ